MTFSNSLIQWYLINKRDLPWRNTNNPYHIWLSEIILQQTRVAQGLPYYKAFIEKFPTIFELANADEENVLKTWQGLGYYSRARNLHYTAKFIADNYNGKFPKSYSELLKLKGIGDYTASAIASFAYKECVAVLDGNVYRVLARYFGIELDCSSNEAKKYFKIMAQEMISQKNPDIYNQAIMEFGALQCVPKNPQCNSCVIQSTCFAYRNNKVSALPVKSKKTKIKTRYLNYCVLINQQKEVLIEKRQEDDIWKNLYQFPLFESNKPMNETEILNAITERYHSDIEVKSIKNETKIIHKLSHQKLEISFIECNVFSNLKSFLPMDKAFEKPYPVVLFNFIEKNYL